MHSLLHAIEGGQELGCLVVAGDVSVEEVLEEGVLASAQGQGAVGSKL